MTDLFVIWQDPDSRALFPVGRLSNDGEGYRFAYTRGAEQSTRFSPFGRMNDLNTVYRSEELFPLFANRLLRKSRPEYADYLRWLGLDGGRYEPLQELARTGGARQTDSLLIYARPERTARGYECRFFGHGIRYLDPEVHGKISSLVEGQRLYPLLDVQNPVDSNAVGLMTGAPSWFIGYVPRYLAPDVRALLEAPDRANMVIQVERNNADAPMQNRLLCRIEADWPEEFVPCSHEYFREVAAAKRTAAA